MEKISEITVYTYGDSSNASCWSNVPYLMTRTFENFGIKVNRINLALPTGFKRIIQFIYKYYNSNSRFYSFNRTNLYFKYVYFKVRSSLKKYKNTQFCVFLNFDCYNKFTNVPSLNFSDWTYEILLNRNNTTPLKGDLKFITRQSDTINNTDLVIPLFQESFEIMSNQYPKANIKSINKNVINIMTDANIKNESIIAKKFNSNYILFIGNAAYKEGLISLIEAIKEIDTINKPKLKVIGMTKEQIQSAPEFVEFYGYLRKDNEQENAVYYDLIQNSKCIANPQKHWAGYSSAIEAMYFYNPVIISPFSQFIKEFGDEPKFGFYVESKETLKQAIINIFTLNNVEYTYLCKNSHHKVKDYTWTNFAKELINLMVLRLDELSCE